MTYTQRPWTKRYSHSNPSITIYGPPDNTMPRGYRICTVYHNMGSNVDDNGMLIGAAPDLLAACEYALDTMSGPDGPEPTMAEKMAMDRLRAAIAKARGE